MHIVIGGYGRVGRYLAHSLEAGGHTVAVIDRSLAAFEEFDEIRGRKLAGMVFDRGTLEQAGIKKADCYCAVTSGDNSNFISARIAKDIYGVASVIARIYEPRRAAIYRDLGIRTISSVEWASAQFLAMIANPDLRSDFQFGGGEVEMYEIDAPKSLYGNRLAEFEIPGELRVASVVRDRAALLPAPGFTVERGDRLYVNVARTSVAKFEQLLDRE
ncbi:MAG: TrkA family potassium uptake protein [Coriobacteriia bacterium]|nr:TrkA family potassium uptake protein [Coriobacteriia bacterium]